MGGRNQDLEEKYDEGPNATLTLRWWSGLGKRLEPNHHPQISRIARLIQAASCRVYTARHGFYQTTMVLQL